MTSLSDSELDALSRRLQTMKALVVDELRDAGIRLQAERLSDPHAVHSFTEDAEIERMDEVRLGEADVDRIRLRDIERAQRRIAEGRYGMCADCNLPIPRERLLAQPTASRCAACQTQVERRPQR